MSYPPPSQLVQAIADEDCVLFIGAGLSMGSGLTGWDEIVRSFSEQLGCSEGHDFLTIAQVYESREGRHALIQKIRHYTDTTRKQPTAVHELLPSLGIRTWMTTNYDDLLETTLRTSGCRYSVVFRDDQFPFGRTDGVVLIKLHGDRTDPKSIVFTKNDYFTASQANPLIWNYLKCELARRTFLFLGYSMRDPDFHQVQAQLLGLLGNDLLGTSYAVMFGVDDVSRADCQTRKISIIDLESSKGKDMTSALVEFLTPLVNRQQQLLRLFPRLYGPQEANRRVPASSKETLNSEGYALIDCIEYDVYAGVGDRQQSSVRPQEWVPPMPRPYVGPPYKCVLYERSDNDIIWKGWAIGKKLGCLD